MISLCEWWRMRGSRSRDLGVICALGAALVACDSVEEPAGGICTAEIRPAVQVRVVDSLSGAPLNGGTSLILLDGTFRDSVTTPSDAATHYLRGTAASAERAGTYLVRVRRSGYATWERANIRVTADACHVQTVELEVRLRPLPS